MADAARRIIDRLARAEFSEDELATTAAALEDVACALETAGSPRRYYGFAEAANSGDVHGFFDRSPLVGTANALAVPIRMWADGDVVRGSVVFGAAYEGPPGCVHGGFIAAAFDELLGFAQSMGGNPGMTGLLSVSYRSPTPLNEELRLEGMLLRVDGRKIYTEGTCYAGDRLTAQAEALFISVGLERFAALLNERDSAGS